MTIVYHSLYKEVGLPECNYFYLVECNKNIEQKLYILLSENRVLSKLSLVNRYLGHLICCMKDDRIFGNQVSPQ